MPKRRANGEGNIRKRKDGRWEGRYTVGHDPETGKAIIKNVLGKTQTEVKEKLKKAIEENVGIDYGRAKNYTVGNCKIACVSLAIINSSSVGIITTLTFDSGVEMIASSP